jgi:hypothetical protein
MGLLVCRRAVRHAAVLRADLSFGRGDRVAEGTRLLSGRGAKTPPRVRIPPSPQRFMGKNGRSSGSATLVVVWLPRGITR